MNTQNIENELKKEGIYNPYLHEFLEKNNMSLEDFDNLSFSDLNKMLNNFEFSNDSEFTA